jgi:hypothetical protein
MSKHTCNNAVLIQELPLHNSRSRPTAGGTDLRPERLDHRSPKDVGGSGGPWRSGGWRRPVILVRDAKGPRKGARRKITGRSFAGLLACHRIASLKGRARLCPEDGPRPIGHGDSRSALWLAAIRKPCGGDRNCRRYSGIPAVFRRWKPCRRKHARVPIALRGWTTPMGGNSRNWATVAAVLVERSLDRRVRSTLSLHFLWPL